MQQNRFLRLVANAEQVRTHRHAFPVQSMTAGAMTLEQSAPIGWIGLELKNGFKFLEDPHPITAGCFEEFLGSLPDGIVLMFQKLIALCGSNGSQWQTPLLQSFEQQRDMTRLCKNTGQNALPNRPRESCPVGGSEQRGGYLRTWQTTEFLDGFLLQCGWFLWRQ